MSSLTCSPITRSGPIVLRPESLTRVVAAVASADDEHGLRACFALADELARVRPGVPLRGMTLSESQWLDIAGAVLRRAEDVEEGSGRGALDDWRRFGPLGL